MVWLHIAENDVVHVGAPGGLRFVNLTPYIRRKDVLGYPVLIHLRSVADFNPADPSPPPPQPESDGGDSGHDGSPDRHYFPTATGPRLQGFRTARGVVDGELNNAGSGSRTDRPPGRLTSPSGPQPPARQSKVPTVIHRAQKAEPALRKPITASQSAGASSPVWSHATWRAGALPDSLQFKRRWRTVGLGSDDPRGRFAQRATTSTIRVSAT